MDALILGKQVFDKEIAAMCTMRDALDGVFAAVVEKIVNCRGSLGTSAKNWRQPFPVWVRPAFFSIPQRPSMVIWA